MQQLNVRKLKNAKLVILLLVQQILANQSRVELTRKVEAALIIESLSRQRLISEKMS